jgi:hypothetical protein
VKSLARGLVTSARRSLEIDFWGKRPQRSKKRAVSKYFNSLRAAAAQLRASQPEV